MRALTAATLILLTLPGCSPDRSTPKQAWPQAPPAANTTQTVQTARNARAAAPGPIALCDRNEPGDRLVFGGRVLDYLGQPLAKAAVLAYHADRQGLYNRRDSPTRVPRLRGVAVTDEHGRFEFRTVRPAAYPDGSEPAHVHVGVMAPAHHARYLDYWFAGDPLITQQRRREAAGNPNTVVVRLARGAEGAWRFRHDIRLQPN